MNHAIIKLQVNIKELKPHEKTTSHIEFLTTVNSEAVKRMNSASSINFTINKQFLKINLKVKSKL